MAQPQDIQNTDPSDPQTEAPETPESPESADPVQALEQAQAAFEAERAEMRDRLMRALADLENTRKRAEKDRREAAMYGGAKLARDLLPVYDNLNRALSVINDDVRGQAQGLVEGVELTLRELLNVMGRHGIERVSPQVGDPFDPHLHEAMFEAPVPDTSAGQIIQVMADGFRLHEQLLRPAQVGVSSTPAG
ncbi:MAG: molecular chaperone GrpE [Rhodobacteraceae bacterium HLUCCA12]|nr:MAG: molecular chaperone GrpE [Rhodobacteraceae bacterium HLUCCA12]